MFKRHKAPPGWIHTPQGREWLAAKMHLKSIAQESYRKALAQQEMGGSDEPHDCSECVHGIGGHCRWDLPDGCLDFLAAQKE